MANPDGSVIIDTKMDTDGVDKGAKEIKDGLEQAADAAEACASKIEDAFEGVDISDAAAGMGDSFENETEKAKDSINSLEDAIKALPDSYQTIYRKIEQIRADDTLDNEQKVDKIKDLYEILGQSQKKSQEKAWEAIKNESEAGSRKVIDNLDDIAKKAAGTGDTLKNKLLDGLDFSSLDGVINSLGQKLGDMVGGSLGSALGGALGGAIGGAIGNLVADGLTQAAGALVDFGKESISLASDLEEVQNVVDVTFTTMSGDVNQFAQDAMRSAGLSETAAKKYTGTFGTMAKSLGFSEKASYAMSTSLTQLTGDISSFYNLDHEEAARKLSAVFTGETESLKELGIVMTQTALDSYAMEQGFGKTTSEMTEQEKVALRYQYVLDGLNDAVGDYSRTSDSWANQTKLLSQQWDQLKTSIGAILIEVLNPLVSVLNTLVLPVLNLFADGLEWVAQHANILGDVITGTMGLLEDLFTPPEEEIQKRMTDSIDTVRSEVEDLGDAYMDTAGKAAESTEIQVGLFDELKISSDKTRDDVIKNINTQTTAFKNYGENLKKLMEYDVCPAIIQTVADGTEEGMLMADTLARGIDEASAQALNDAFELRQEAMAEANAEVAEVLNSLTKQVEKVASETEEVYGEMADAIEDDNKSIQKSIDGLQGKTIDIILNYIETGAIPASAVTGYSSPITPSSSVTYPIIASGTVIPPNAPYSVSQSITQSGNNVSASEAWRIMTEAMNSNPVGVDVNVNLDSNVPGLVSFLTPKITAEQRRNSRAGGG